MNVGDVNQLNMNENMVMNVLIHLNLIILKLLWLMCNLKSNYGILLLCAMR